MNEYDSMATWAKTRRGFEAACELAQSQANVTGMITFVIGEKRGYWVAAETVYNSLSLALTLGTKIRHTAYPEYPADDPVAEEKIRKTLVDLGGTAEDAADAELLRQDGLRGYGWYMAMPTGVVYFLGRTLAEIENYISE